MNIICTAVYIDGIVQGVGFRYFTQQKATELALTGQVRNLSDGRVEAVVCGEQKQVDALIAWFKQGGPRTARVTQVVAEPRAVKVYTGFKIAY